MSVVAGTPKNPNPRKPITYKPEDWLRGSTKVGSPYTAWNTYGQGRPDFGAGNGPGEPYHEVQKKVHLVIKPKLPPWATGGGIPQSHVKKSPNPEWDARIAILRKRLGWAT